MNGMGIETLHSDLGRLLEGIEGIVRIMPSSQRRGPSHKGETM